MKKKTVFIVTLLGIMMLTSVACFADNDSIRQMQDFLRGEAFEANLEGVGNFLRGLGILGIIGLIFGLASVVGLIILVLKVVTDIIVTLLGKGPFSTAVAYDTKEGKKFSVTVLKGLLNFSTFSPGDTSLSQAVANIPASMGAYAKEKWLYVIGSVIAIALIGSGRLFSISAGLIGYADSAFTSSENLIESVDLPGVLQPSPDDDEDYPEETTRPQSNVTITTSPQQLVTDYLAGDTTNYYRINGTIKTAAECSKDEVIAYINDQASPAAKEGLLAQLSQ